MVRPRARLLDAAFTVGSRVMTPSGSPRWKAKTRIRPFPSSRALTLNWSGRLSPEAGTLSVPRASPSTLNPRRGWTRTSIDSPAATSMARPVAVGAAFTIETSSHSTVSTTTVSGNSASSDRSVPPSSASGPPFAATGSPSPADAGTGGLANVPTAAPDRRDDLLVSPPTGASGIARLHVRWVGADPTRGVADR